MNNYLFWKTPNYFYNFKQSNKLYFHYFFCFYIVLINFFYCTVINRHVMLYNKLNIKTLEYSKYKNFFKTSITKIPFNNNFKIVNSLKKKNYFFKKMSDLVNLNYNKFDIQQYDSKTYLEFNTFFNKKFNLNNNNKVFKNFDKELKQKSFNNNNDINNEFNEKLKIGFLNKIKYAVYNKIFFFNIPKIKDIFIFVLKFFYVNSKLHIVMYFNNVNTFLKIFKQLNLYKFFSVAQINSVFLYNEISKYRKLNKFDDVFFKVSRGLKVKKNFIK